METNGKYYLDEERLKQFQERRAQARPGGIAAGGGYRPREPTWSRTIAILLMLPIGLIVVVVTLYLAGFRGGYFPGEFLVLLLVIFLALFVVRVLFWESRRRRWREQSRRPPTSYW